MDSPRCFVGARAIVVTLATLLLIANGAGGSAASAAGLSSAGPSVVTNCTSAQVRAALASFVSAFSAGEYRRLNGLFAAPMWFRWYSSSRPGERVGAAAQRRATLVGYFRSRHASRDQLRLVSFKFNGNTLGYGNFVFKMKRSAADFREGAWFTVEAKGAALCEGASTRFIVMSVGAHQ